jgi:DedD protein
MTAVFTNRLIGTAILIVAAVVFLPDLLDGRKQVSKDDFKAIPERPEFAEVAQPAVFSQDQHQAAQTAAMAPVTDNSPALDLPSSAATPADQTATDPAAQSTVTPGNTTTDPDPMLNANPAVTEPVAQSPAGANQAATSQASTSQAGNVQTATLPAVTLPAEKTTTEQPAPAKVEKPLSQAAYVVKVGSFSKEQNANALVSKLKAAGHNAFTRKIVNSQGTTMVSVLVGPDLKKDKLEAKLAELQQLAQVPKLKVSSYQPIEN